MSITFIILGITIAVSILALTKREYFYKLEYNPYSVLQRKQWYRLISHALIHVDYMHLAVNMWVLYIFGRNVEFLYGLMFGSQSKWFLILLYVGGILFSSLPALKKHGDNPNYSAVGASGAVSAVLFAAILLEPMRSIGFLFIPIGMPAFVFGNLRGLRGAPGVLPGPGRRQDGDNPLRAVWKWHRSAHERAGDILDRTDRCDRAARDLHGGEPRLATADDHPGARVQAATRRMGLGHGRCRRGGAGSGLWCAGRDPPSRDGPVRPPARAPGGERKRRRRLPRPFPPATR